MDNNHVTALRAKHASLDNRISEEDQRPNPDTILLHSLKKEKLKIKEMLHRELVAS
jgi:hypothetical protein